MLSTCLRMLPGGARIPSCRAAGDERKTPARTESRGWGLSGSLPGGWEGAKGPAWFSNAL
jgi:hypothetical protein